MKFEVLSSDTHRISEVRKRRIGGGGGGFQSPQPRLIKVGDLNLLNGVNVDKKWYE